MDIPFKIIILKLGLYHSSWYVFYLYMSHQNRVSELSVLYQMDINVPVTA